MIDDRIVFALFSHAYKYAASRTTARVRNSLDDDVSISTLDKPKKPILREHAREWLYLVNTTRDVGHSDLWLAGIPILPLAGSWGSEMAARIS